MKIYYHQQYQKSLQRLNEKLQRKACETMVKFTQNQFNETLYNHSLHGNLSGYRSISVTGNIRILFRYINGNIECVELLDIGTHSHLYR